MAILNYKKAARTESAPIRQLRTVNLIDALVDVLTLQNTMIIANDGEITGGMKILSIISSTVIWLFIVLLSVKSFKCSDF